MHWRRTDPVQSVGGLLVTGPGAADRLADAMIRKSALLQALPVEHGEDWAAVFAGPVGQDADVVLPRIDGSTPIYASGEGWWLPVGVEVDAPEPARAALWRAMGDHWGVRPPAIVVPKLTEGVIRSREADLFLVREPIPFAKTVLARRSLADARP